MLDQMKNTPFDVLGFGEVMLRLSPVGKERISQSETFDKCAGGAELNVVSGISQLGCRTGIITRLPDNEIGKFIKNKIRYSGISDDFITYDQSAEKRLGIYYYESGAYPRVPTVVYDRANSSFINCRVEDVSEEAYASTKVFHLSGITLALNPSIRETALEIIKRFKEQGAFISFDVNYRASLWDEDTARACLMQVMQDVDILFVSEETLRRMFRQKGDIHEIQRKFARQFNDVKVIASTRRVAKTPTRHTWHSIAYSVEEDSFFEEAPYEDIEVVDRIGSGDAYVAGALYGLIQYRTIEDAVRYGNAMSALKNTIPGDMTACDAGDIRRVIDAHTKGQESEMVR